MAQEINVETGEVIAIDQAATFVARQEAAALDVQVSTAKAYPRSIQSFQADLESWALIDRPTAMECFFNVKKGGETIVGPSIRFAELIVAAWGNIVVDTAIVAEEADHVIVSATCRDLQRNTGMRSQVRRNIVTKHGKRYGADMIQTTIQAASAIARRNAIFQTIPRALWGPVWEKARQLALAGDQGETFTERRKRILHGLKDAGCEPAYIKHALGGKEPKDLSADDVLVLEVALRRIVAKDSTPEQEFPRPVNEGEDRGESAAKAAQSISSARSKAFDPEKPKQDAPTNGGDPLRDEEPPDDYAGPEDAA